MKNENITDNAGTFDDPDFAGILIQLFHVTGDERMPEGDPTFIPRACLTYERLQAWNERADWDDSVSIRYLRYW